MQTAIEMRDRNAVAERSKTGWILSGDESLRRPVVFNDPVPQSHLNRSNAVA
jgi:hypothetical protein